MHGAFADFVFYYIKKIGMILLIVLNIIGIVLLVHFAIPYITYNTTILNPNAILPFEAWDRAGMILTLGFVPLLAINILSFIL